MKKLWILVPAAVLLLAASLQASTDDKIVITGSHIPQKVKRVGITGSSMAPLLVLDRTAINRTGANTVAGVMSKVTFAQVRGR